MTIEHLTIPAIEEYEWQVHYRPPNGSGEWVWDKAFKFEYEARAYAHSVNSLWDVLLVHRPSHK